MSEPRPGMQPADIGRLTAVGDPRVSPDGGTVAFTFTTVDPRRSSITISCDVTTGDLCTSTGTNAAFAGIALAGATLRPAIGPVSWTARSAATTQRRKRLAFKR